MTSPLEPIEIITRFSIAAIAGILIGLDRDLKGKAAGVRTIGLVALGSAMITLTGILAGPGNIHGDPESRVIQGIVAGIGFLGGGVILRDTSTGEVRGLTTAASVWVAAGAGILAGLGAYLALVASGALAALILVLGKPIERLAQLLFGTDRED
jgi:putative Mg2+ transporter-C (MgtC) family protein